jgi:hypothetical protein
MTKKDYVIILGDFGLVWSGDKQDNYLLTELDSRNFTTLWIDGNHENFDLLSKYPVTEWNGGKVQFIRDSIIHLMRGQVYTIDDLKFFTFGGAESTDKSFRTEGKTWWKQEIPSTEEFLEAVDNLRINDLRVDYVLSHTAPDTVIREFSDNPNRITDPTSRFLGNIDCLINYREWYFGHFHKNLTYDRYHCLYDHIVDLIL